MINNLIQDAARFLETGDMSTSLIVLIMIVLLAAAIVAEIVARKGKRC